MKKSYTLLGTFLDGKDSLIVQMPVCQSENEVGYCEDYHRERNLFDVNTVRRSIRFSEILRLKDEAEFSQTMRALLWCNKIFVLVDIVPKAPSSIVTDFFIKRLVQSYLMVKKSNTQADVSLSVRDCLYAKLRTLLEDYVRRCLTK